MFKQLANLSLTKSKSLFFPSFYLYSKLTNEINFTPSFTQVIQKRMQQIMKTDNSKFLRLKVDMGKGCGGFQYDFQMDKNQPKDSDFALVVKGNVTFACDDLSLLLIKGCTIDFIDNGVSQIFKILDNPNVQSLCHCENSFHPTDEVLKALKNKKK